MESIPPNILVGVRIAGTQLTVWRWRQWSTVASQMKQQTLHWFGLF